MSAFMLPYECGRYKRGQPLEAASLLPKLLIVFLVNKLCGAKEGQYSPLYIPREAAAQSGEATRPLGPRWDFFDEYRLRPVILIGIKVTYKSCYGCEG